MKEVIFYEKDNGKVPVYKIINYLEKNNSKMLAKFYYKLDFLKIGFIQKEDVKYLKEKIYELRVKDDSNISRFFYFYYNFNEIIILDGFIKKNDKLQNSILNKIIEYKKDYIKRTG